VKFEKNTMGGAGGGGGGAENNCRNHQICFLNYSRGFASWYSPCGCYMPNCFGGIRPKCFGVIKSHFVNPC